MVTDVSEKVRTTLSTYTFAQKITKTGKFMKFIWSAFESCKLLRLQSESGIGTKTKMLHLRKSLGQNDCKFHGHGEHDAFVFFNI